MPAYEKHIFICQNLRENGQECCGAKGGAGIQEAMKKRLQELGLSIRFRANKSGCLNNCKNGVSLVIYPQGIWYNHVTLSDVNEIIEKSIIGNEIIERLTK